MKDELLHFVDMLEGADVDGRALSLALATDLKNRVFQTPQFVEARQNGTATMLLVKLYQNLQKDGQMPSAAGCAICIHTERAANDLTLVVPARRMWSLLSEAFPFVEDAADQWEMMTGMQLNLNGYDRIPEELKP